MEVVGFAASILTFLDISYKIVRGTYEIHSVASGATLENTHIGVVTQDLENVTSRLKADPRKINDPQLIEISDNCHALSQDLVKLLQKLQAKGDSRRESFKAAWAVLRKQSDVKKLEERLDHYRSQIELRLLFLLCTGDSVLKQQLEQIRHMSIEVHNQNTRELEDVQNKLDRTLRELQAHAKDTATRDEYITEDVRYLVDRSDKISRGLDQTIQNIDIRQSEEENEDNGYCNLVEKLSELKIFMEKIPHENRILRRLCFESILGREEAISSPVAETYVWMLQAPKPRMWRERRIEDSSIEKARRWDTATKFMSFLKEDNQTFFITGRAGSGKSTLMKFLGRNGVVLDTLATWACERKLVVVGMYFWSSDDPLQKSIKGFYRSILYHTLKQCPELIDIVFPGSDSEGLFSDAIEFQLPELEEAFSRLMDLKNSETHRFCYFIDGLDEYDGDPLEHRNLAQKLVAWGDSRAVKLVCSARPYKVFLDAFEDVGTTIKFHELTRSDIRDFAHYQFTTSLDTPELAGAKKTCLGIIEDIVTRASGVFIWASLVVRSLINGALEGQAGQCLKKRLQDCPDDLNSLFRKMLDGIDSSPWNRQCSNIILYLATHNPFDMPLNALIYSWLPEVNWLQEGWNNTCEFPFDSMHEPLLEADIMERHDHVRNLLHRSTRGLLEMVESSESIPFYRYRVDFFHRSVRTYLQEEWAPRTTDNPLSSTLQKVEVYSRLRAAEAKFAPNAASVEGAALQEADWLMYRLFEYTFIWLGDCERAGECEPPLRCIQELGDIACRNTWSAAMVGSSDDAPLRIFRGKLSVERNRSWRMHMRQGAACSFVHYASYWSQSSYVRQRLGRGSVDKDNTRMNLLLTASIATDCDITRLLLSQGRQPSERVEISQRLSPDHLECERQEHKLGRLASVWMVLLRDFANNVTSYCMQRRQATTYYPYLNLDWMCRLAEILEMHLRAGADRTVYFVVGESPASSEDALEWADHFRVDLHQMLDIFKPPNLSSLQKLLSDKLSLKDRLRTSWLAKPARDPYPDLRPPIATELLLQTDFKVWGVVSDYDEPLLGDFEVRVF